MFVPEGDDILESDGSASEAENGRRRSKVGKTQPANSGAAHLEPPVEVVDLGEESDQEDWENSAIDRSPRLPSSATFGWPTPPTHLLSPSSSLIQGSPANAASDSISVVSLPRASSLSSIPLAPSTPVNVAFIPQLEGANAPPSNSHATLQTPTFGDFTRVRAASPNVSHLPPNETPDREAQRTVSRRASVSTTTTRRSSSPSPDEGVESGDSSYEAGTVASPVQSQVKVAADKVEQPQQVNEVLEAFGRWNGS